MPNPLCTYNGFGSSITSALCNASSGNLSQWQVDSIKDDATQQVIQASAGRQPAVVDALIAQVHNEIDSVLTSFSLPGESGEDVGATPQQSCLRIPGTGCVDLAKLSQIIPKLPNLTNLKWYALGIGAIVALFYAFPVIAPGIKRNISAAASLR